MDNVAELVNQGLTVTLIGMTVVFVLLTALVGVVRGMSAFSRLIVGIEPGAEAAPVDAELTAVIAAAIRHYRRSET